MKTYSVVSSLVMAALAILTPSATAQPLDAVPMQGGMVMPMVGYHAEHGHAHVMSDDSIVPILTPLLVSNPGTGFAATDPWFDLLDPTRQGLAFSRRYGFMMDADSDPLPEGTSFWIRMLSSSPQLGAYRYRNTDPKSFEPIFGTAGSSNALAWDGLMFHPCFTAPAGTNLYSARFEVFLKNTATGDEVAGSTSGPFDLYWTALPDGRPSLQIGQKLVIDWPPQSGNYVLESADSFPASQWTQVSATPVTVNGRPTVILDPGAGAKFYRLRSQP